MLCRKVNRNSIFVSLRSESDSQGFAQRPGARTWNRLQALDQVLLNRGFFETKDKNSNSFETSGKQTSPEFQQLIKM